ncbi:MAG: energy transducer TonB [Sphingomonas sp.]|uniref:energy transducer TonB n=1 Tax=Sphingomonas sp. TaxID=28214 RepID=UPI003F80A2FE
MATYADRYGSGPTVKPGSLTLALAMTALPVVGLALGLQIRNAIEKPTTLDTYVVTPERKPPPPDPKPHPKAPAPQNERVYVPPVQPPPVDKGPPLDLTWTPPPPPAGGEIGKALDPAPVKPVATPKPVMVDAFVDPQYSRYLQPPYPPEEQRAGNGGRVVLRVLIGTDGRVKQVEKVSAASDAFFAAAQRQALGKWRFKPATKDGVPFEQWKVMSLRFELNE